MLRTVRSSLLLLLGILVTIECSSKPPKPQIVYVRRKHPKKSADTIPLGPPYINLNDPAVLCAKRFVRAMLDGDRGTAEAMISPRWLGENDITMDTYVVSQLELPEVPPPPRSRYVITDVQGDKVSVEATTQNGRSRRLTVQISKGNGTDYVVPSGADDCCYSVDPWYWPPEPQRTR